MVNTRSWGPKPHLVMYDLKKHMGVGKVRSLGNARGGGPGDPCRGRAGSGGAGAPPVGRGAAGSRGGTSWPPGGGGRSVVKEVTAGGARRRRWRRTSCHRLPQTWCRRPPAPPPRRAAAAARTRRRRRPTPRRRGTSGTRFRPSLLLPPAIHTAGPASTPLPSSPWSPPRRMSETP